VSAPSLLAGRSVSRQGSALATALLRAFGWRVAFDGLPSRQGVLIVYPHTSNWDFAVGLLAKWSIGIPVAFWGKDSLFALPLFGRWLRWVGGVPVDRSSARGVVAQMVERLQAAKRGDEFFWLALAPEGTRSYRDHWRTGFYRTALEAAVPLGLAYIDFEHKVVGVDAFMMLSGDADADMAAIAARLGHRRGRRPHLAAPIRLPAKEPKA
jgi:1-acyl-sn-glycerol-3-phosphate acyltransferase